MTRFDKAMLEIDATIIQAIVDDVRSPDGTYSVQDALTDIWEQAQAMLHKLDDCKVTKGKV